ncbi:MAG: uL15 family ribosomal protein [Candidatus Micrarchaeota archaeon]|nr:uL15 family ribosomal protein [Candidatus Micrarchaeota archaeon]
MVRRHRKKNTRMLGSRSWGHGNIKNRRGKGSKGGSGRGGGQKHKFSYVTAYDPDRFGKHGFFRHGAAAPTKVINLFQIDAMAKKGMLQKSGEAYAFDFDGKVLGTGRISAKVSVSALSFSKNAEEKIRAAGGEAKQEARKKSPEK